MSHRVSTPAFKGQRFRPVSTLHLHTSHGERNHSFSPWTSPRYLVRQFPQLGDTRCASKAESNLCQKVWDDHSRFASLQNVPNRLKRAIAGIIGNDERPARCLPTGWQWHEKACCTSAMIDGAIPMLVNGTEIAQHLTGEKGPQGFRQPAVRAFHHLVARPHVAMRLVRRVCQSGHARPDILGAVKERLANAQHDPDRGKRIGNAMA